MRHRKKAQIAVTDLFIAAVIFAILVTAVMFTWNKYNVKINTQLGYNEMMVRAFHISDLLVKYPGRPTNWEHRGNISIIGLAKDDRILDKNKVSNFTSLDYDKIREYYNMEFFDFYFNLTDINGNDFSPSIYIGSPDGNYAIGIRRLVIYNDEPAIMQFTLYR